ncbi:ABC transporter substrate-binding protein [Corynebacterium hindlerae]|uniref:ABC transporter substrate-binding protein n=1 Tax=Corynebacterium hindlerae TaxID=699041 RepID=UPI003AAE8158
MKKLVLLACSYAATAGLLTGCVGAPEQDSGAKDAGNYSPVTVTNCGVETTYDQAPTHAVTLNQAATETLLALGLEDSMVGTAYIDDSVAPEWEAAYQKVPQLSGSEYPSKEAFLKAEPDFAYSAYASAFSDKAVGSRDELKASGINSHIIPFGCPEKKDRPTGADMTAVWQETRDIAKIFGVTDRGEELVKDQQARLEALKQQTPAAGKSIFWYDSGDKDPFVGVGEGGPQIIIDALGGKNIFADRKGNWDHVSWESVVEQNPDVIVLADAAWNSAEQKKQYLKNDPVLSQLKAVQNDAFVTVKFSESSPGVSLVGGAERLADQVKNLG